MNPDPGDSPSPEGEEGEQTGERVADALDPRKQGLRMVALVLVVGGLLAVGKWTGLTDMLDKEAVRTYVESAGAWGALAFLGLFCAGVLLGIPGLVFVAVGVVAFGRTFGGPSRSWGVSQPSRSASSSSARSAVSSWPTSIGRS